ncbi:type II toxin-antitoxin system VapC family toxin [uncultured Enterovirga sp.]|uniref:type II toxin-antitoxin system VapC family toxin n=1 Tax=uncultured Enterovirga sp. TaxID=2026352 RepID=UPI0035CAFCAD
MIAVDTSAIVAIALEEPEERRYIIEIASRGAIIGTTTLVETSTVLSRLDEPVANGFLTGLLQARSVRTVDFSREMFEAARDAYRRYGKGQGHPAQLNFGDCLSYAVAKVCGVPLLFKGNDFSRTDIVPAYTP